MLKERRFNHSFYSNPYIFNNTNITLLIEASSSKQINRVALAFREYLVPKRGLMLTQQKHDINTHNLHKLHMSSYQMLAVLADRFCRVNIDY